MTEPDARIAQVQDAVRGLRPGQRLLPVAGATKPGLSHSAREDVEAIDVSEIRGIVEYDPDELTVTALAGTPVQEVQAALAEHGQYLPFDPPLPAAGATLGGVVAAGASGAGALRHGGVRDFVIGVRFVDGTGRLVGGGGKVVKNAAGFDLPKLMVGSIGRLGVLVQLSFKVFPRPAATASLEYRLDATGAALATVATLAACPVELEALDVAPGGRLLVRLGGGADTLDARLARIQGVLDAPAVVLSPLEEQDAWHDAAELAWAPPGSAVVRVGLTIRRALALDTALAAIPGAVARYSLGGAVAWIAWPADRPLDHLTALLADQRLAGTVLLGPPDHALLGPRAGGAFAQRIAGALDPEHRFLEV